MVVAIVGSRTFTDYNLLCNSISNMINTGLKIGQIVSGGAKGADSLAERFSREHNIPLQVFRANWNIFGKSAGFKRNVDIVKNSDLVLAFWDGKSNGTKHTINLAHKLKKKVIVEYV